MDRLLATSKNMSDAEMLTSNNQRSDLPTSLSDSQKLFRQTCLTDNGKKSSSQIMLADGFNQYTLTCGQQNIGKNIQFIFTTANQSSQLVDLQVVQISTEVAPETDTKYTLKMKDAGQIILAVGLSTLASGLLAHFAYPGQNDKLQHILIGNIIAATGTLLAYYGFKLTENQAFLVGFGLAIIAGVLKELYDKNHKSSHTPDAHDGYATAAGGLLGALAIRIKIEY